MEGVPETPTDIVRPFGVFVPGEEVVGPSSIDTFGLFMKCRPCYLS